MTCIAGIANKGTVWLGGDACASGEMAVEVHSHPKVFQRGELVIGVCGSFRVMDIIETLKWPSVPKRSLPRQYLIRTFVPHLIINLAAGVSVLEKDKTMQMDASLLVGLRGHLFYLDSDFHVGEFQSGYGGIGSGGAWAAGCLYGLRGVALPPEEKLMRALGAAQAFCKEVREPFTIVSTDG